MKLIKLARPFMLDNAVRFPAEGAFMVDDDQADLMASDGALDGEAIDMSDVPEEPAPPRRKAKSLLTVSDERHSIEE